MVIELWRGPNRTCPHRCMYNGRSCHLETNHVPPALTKSDSFEPSTLPYKLAGVDGEPHTCRGLLWKHKASAPKPIEIDENDEEWDLF